MSRLRGCRLEELTAKEKEDVLGWVINGDDPPKEAVSFQWLLAHCRDGVTWGRPGEQGGAWLFSARAFPDLSPEISRENLLELRLFGPDREILLWRDETGFSARLIVDSDPLETDPCRPAEEERVLLGDRFIEARDGFTRVGSASGREQAVPLKCEPGDFADGHWPLRLAIRHYFAADPQTGAALIAATRLVAVGREGT